jgi:hypothetical protein
MEIYEEVGYPFVTGVVNPNAGVKTDRCLMVKTPAVCCGEAVNKAGKKLEEGAKAV